MALPSRLRFAELAADQIPSSEAVSHGGLNVRNGSDDFIDAAIARWRGATMSTRQHAEAAAQDTGAPPVAAPTATRLDPERYKLLKKPPDLRPREG